MAPELILVGVGHVFDIGSKIEEIIKEEMPDAIALELDFERAIALQNKEQKRQAPNFLYALLAKVQTVIAKKFGEEAGKEMVAALRAAAELSIPTYYIDMNARKIVSRIWYSMSIREKLSLLFSAFLSIFIRKKRIEGEIKKFQDSANSFLEKMEKDFPEIKHILIDERNEHMAKNLINLMEQKEKVIAIVGEGHIKGLQEILENKEIKLRIIHLKDLLPH